MQTETKSPEMIQVRAYQIWEAEGRPHGRDQAHWYQAERELGALAHVTAEPAAGPAAKAAPKTRRRSGANGSSTGRKRKTTEARI